ncbi:MAG: putative N-methylproline demethylase [Pseudonocardiales bacterium]|nr:putative N-methylproline demethylase [Pseudonocardiales bacterium]
MSNGNGSSGSLSKLFSPITIRRTEVRNRVVITSHGASEAFRNPGASPDTYIEYLRRRAAGGVGLIITQPPFFTPGVGHTQQALDRHAALASAIRAEGAVVLLQLAHLGAFARSDADVHRPPLWGFGATQSAAGETAHQMTDDEIELMIDAYRQTAQLAAEAGFDGVEVHGAHGYLIQQSLTPSYNPRTDKWGQDRTLFARRVLTAARDALGEGGIVGYRTSTDDMRSPDDGGIGFRAGVEIVRRLLDTGVIDVLNTTIGDGGVSYARAIPDYRYGEAPNIPAVVRLREAVGITVPIIGVGKIASVGVAESVLAAGECDLVAMTRAHIADPDLLAKARSGRTERIRPCVGANVCVNRKLAGFPEISCFHNPQVLREVELAIRPTEHVRRVLVVGAGPAGLKAAEVAAKSGHDVSVFDSAAKPGGRLRYAGLTAATSLVSTVEHVLAELAILSVKVQHGVVVDEAVLIDLAPDEVILASGGRPVPSTAFPGAAEAGVLDSAEALEGEVGRTVLVYDTVGANEGALVAEALAARGCRVTFVTPFETVTPNGGQLHRVQLPQTLYRRLDRVITSGVIGMVTDGVALVATAAGDTIAEIAPDTFVAITAPVPNLDLVPALNRLGLPYQIVGDALAPRQAMQAFKEGHQAALAVGA